MRGLKSSLVALTLALVAAAGTARGQTRPATRPAGAVPAGIQRVQDAIAGLDLSDEQKVQFQAIKDKIAQSVRAMAGELKDLPPAERRDKLAAALGEARKDLQSILTPEQRQQLRQRVQDRRAPGRTPAADADAPAPPATQAAASQPVGTAPPLAAGTPAPAFSLKRVNGSDVSNKTYAGRPLVVVFGSLTSPSFRDRLAKLEALKTKYRGRAAFLIVYTREAHPADGWQVTRNRDDRLEINRPTTADERKALAVQLRDRARLTIDIAVDTMDDTTTVAFGDVPDGAVVVSPAGSVVGTQAHCDPSGLPRLIDLAMKIRD